MENLNATEVTEFFFLAFANSSRYPVLLFIVFLFLYLFIIFGNILMLLVISYDARLHTPMYMLVFMFSCSDMCYLTCIIPQTLRNLVTSTSSILYHNCAIQMFFCNTFGEVQLLLITVMTYDRYVCISNPLRYNIIMGPKTCFTFLGFALLFSGTIAFVFVYLLFRLPFCFPPLIEHFFCDMTQILFLTCPTHIFYRMTVVIAYSLGMAMISSPLVVLMLNYIYIVIVILKIRTNEGRWKAFSTFSYSIPLVVVELGCLWFMYFRPADSYYLDKDKAFVMAFTFTTPILNPVVYTIRNKAVYHGVKKLFSIKLF